jgi:hypothetical protein
LPTIEAGADVGGEIQRARLGDKGFIVAGFQSINYRFQILERLD